MVFWKSDRETDFLAPPNYALWLPPQTEHCSIALDHSVTHFICIRVHPSLCDQLPREVKTLSIRPFLLALVREILEQSSGALVRFILIFTGTV